MFVRVRTPVMRFRSDVLSPYQSPPPPYLSRAMPTERDPGGVAVARAGRAHGPNSASCTSATPASAATSARRLAGLGPGRGSSGRGRLLMPGLKHVGGGTDVPPPTNAAAFRRTPRSA